MVAKKKAKSKVKPRSKAPAKSAKKAAKKAVKKAAKKATKKVATRASVKKVVERKTTKKAAKKAAKPNVTKKAAKKAAAPKVAKKVAKKPAKRRKPRIAEKSELKELTRVSKLKRERKNIPKRKNLKPAPFELRGSEGFEQCIPVQKGADRINILDLLYKVEKSLANLVSAFQSKYPNELPTIYTRYGYVSWSDHDPRYPFKELRKTKVRHVKKFWVSSGAAYSLASALEMAENELEEFVRKGQTLPHIVSDVTCRVYRITK